MQQVSARHTNRWIVPGVCATFLGLFAVLAVLMANVEWTSESVAKYDADDDEAWAAISRYEVSWTVVEPLEGAAAEKAIEALGPPVHRRRRTEASTRCKDVYLYPVRTAERHAIVGLCIDDLGRVNGSVGQGGFGGRGFDLRFVENDRWSAPIFIGGGIGLVVAVLAAWRRRNRPSVIPSVG